jgi:phospholipase/lecithinase/hemolysin
MSRFLFLTAVLVAFATVLAPSGAKADSIDLSRLVVVGDSLSAGHQNSCLLGSQQVNGFANLVAERAGADLRLPLIGEPGFPPCLVLVDPGPPPVVEPNSDGFGVRLDPTVRTLNLSVPGARVGDALDPDPDDKFHINFGFPFAALHELVLPSHEGPAKSQVDLAVELEPTALLVWLGSNDVLWAAVGGDPAHVTREKIFRAGYQDMMVRLAATGAAMVVANIPDATTIPFLTPAESVEAITGSYFGLAPGDYVTPLAWIFISAELPLPDNVVVDATELAEIQAAIDTFNAIIAEQAALHGAALVDMNAVLRFIKTYGLAVGGRRLTTDFLGGIFTLDGIHPTNTSHAVIANEFVRALNDGFDAGIEPFSVGEIAQIMHSDPLILPGVGQPPLAEPFTSLEILGSLDFIRNGP